MHYKHFSSTALFCHCLFYLLFSIFEVAWGEPVWSAVKGAAIGVEGGHFWPGLKKKSDQVLVLVVVTFDRVGIDLADVVSNGVTEKGKALVIVFSMPMQFLHLKIVCQKVYIFFENRFLMACQKLKLFDIYVFWHLCFIRSCPRKLIANGIVLGWNLLHSIPRLF